MGQVEWFVLAGTRGGRDRTRVVEVLAERPRPGEDLVDSLDLEEDALRDHLRVLAANDLVEASERGDETVYRLTPRARANGGVLDELVAEPTDEVPGGRSS